MSTERTSRGPIEGGLEITPFVWKALTEPMFVNDDDPDAPLDSEVAVYNEWRQYIVNLDVNFCTCPCHQYHCGPGDACKHILRARFARGELAIPSRIGVNVLDDQLRKRLGL